MSKKSSNDKGNIESLYYLGYINEVYKDDIKEMLDLYVDYLNNSENSDNRRIVSDKLAGYFYIFNHKLKYHISANLFSECIEAVSRDSINIIADNCLL